MPRSPLSPLRVLGLILLVATGHAARSAEPESRPLVYVIDGAGDLRGCSTSLNRALFAEGNPVELRPIVWTHSADRRKLLLDQTDVTHARRQGFKLADAVREANAKEQGRRLVVVAHSAGCAVALAAAERLADGPIDRLILLAPSVSKDYDLAPAAAACREGIDVYCSYRDRWALGVAMRLIGTTDDRKSRLAAGRVGFENHCPTELVRQHFWSSELKADGHDGGHYGAYSPAFVKRHLLPLMLGNVK